MARYLGSFMPSSLSKMDPVLSCTSGKGGSKQSDDYVKPKTFATTVNVSVENKVLDLFVLTNPVVGASRHVLSADSDVDPQVVTTSSTLPYELA